MNQDPVDGPERAANLPPSPAGDILAARAFADRLLEALGPPPSERSSARLLLAAACLWLQGRTWSQPSLRELLSLLVGFGSGVDAAALFAKSPVPFLQFASAEIADLDPAARLAALKWSVRATARIALAKELQNDINT